MVVEGTIAEHIVKIEPTIYRNYIWHHKKGRQCLFTVKKVLYGTLEAALLFRKLPLDTLKTGGS